MIAKIVEKEKTESEATGYVLFWKGF